MGLKSRTSLQMASGSSAPKSPTEVIVSEDHASAIRVFPLLFLSLSRGVSVFISASKTLTYPSGKGQWAEVGICGKGQWAEVGICGQGTNVRERGLQRTAEGLEETQCIVGTWECVERMWVCSGIWLSCSSSFHTTSDAPHTCFTYVPEPI